LQFHNTVKVKQIVNMILSKKIVKLGIKCHINDKDWYHIRIYR